MGRVLEVTFPTLSRGVDRATLKELYEEYLPLIEDAIKSWRMIYHKEKNSRRNNKESIGNRLGKEYIYGTVRPFFERLSPDDSRYIRTHRMIVFGMMEHSPSLKAVVLKASGKKLAKLLLREGIVRSLDDLPMVFIVQRIGLLDIVDESLNTMKVNIYECMSCFGMKPVFTPMCDFEAGIIEGILEGLYGRNATIEKNCWGLGDHFCGFEVYFR